MNPDTIIPVRLQHELQQAAEQADVGYWHIGDCCNRILEANAKHPKRVPVMEVYRAVAFYTQKSAGTVRGYTDCSAFWDKDHRDEFPQFGRHHILAVMPHVQGESLVERRNNASELLLKACEKWDTGIPTVDGLRAWLKADNGKPAWQLAWERILQACRRLLERDDVPAGIRAAVERLTKAGG